MQPDPMVAPAESVSQEKREGPSKRPRRKRSKPDFKHKIVEVFLIASTAIILIKVLMAEIRL